MKSKISFFNPALCKKNFTLYWPILLFYTLVLVLYYPVRIYLDMQIYFVGQPEIQEMRQNFFKQAMNSEEIVVVCAIAAPIIALIMFSYLFQTKSAYMIHALPTTRMELLGTNYITGLGFMILPTVLCYFLTMMICIFYEVTCVQYLGIWLLYVLMLSVLFYSMTVVCCFLTGSWFMVPVLYLALHIWYPAGVLVLNEMMQQFSCCLNELDFAYLDGVWSPIICLEYYRIASSKFQEMHFPFYMIGSLCLVVLAAYLYQKRKLECTQDILAFKFLEGPVRWIGGFILGWFSQYVLCSWFGDIIIWSIPGKVIFSVLLAVIYMIGLDMFLRKSYRVINKKKWKEILCYITSLVVVWIGIGCFSIYSDNRRYDKEDIVSSELWFYGQTIYEIVDLEDEILKLNDYLLDHREEMIFHMNGSTVEVDGTCPITFTYLLKNGKLVSKTYYVILNQMGNEFIDQLNAVYFREDNFERAMFGVNQEDILSCNMDIQVIDTKGDEEHYISASDYPSNMRIQERILEALKKDWVEGNFITKHNTEQENQQGITYEQEKYSWLSLWIRIRTEDERRIELLRRSGSVGYTGDNIYEIGREKWIPATCEHFYQCIEEILQEESQLQMVE